MKGGVYKMDEENTATAENIDVNQSEESTDTTDTSGSDQTTDEGESTESQDTETEGKESKSDSNTVPYERFAETNSKVAALQSEIEAMKRERISNQNIDPQQAALKESAKEAFKTLADELGYVSKDELRQLESDRKLESSLTELEKEFDGKKIPGLKFDRQKVIDFAIKEGIGNPRIAFEAMHKTEFTNLAVKQALTKGKGIKSEGSNGSGTQNAGGPSNDDLKVRMAKGDEQAKKLYLKRVTRQAFGGK